MNWIIYQGPIKPITAINQEIKEGVGQLALTATHCRRDHEPGCLLVQGPSQMLPLAKKYFYPSLNDAITANEIKWAT